MVDLISSSPNTKDILPQSFSAIALIDNVSSSMSTHDMMHYIVAGKQFQWHLAWRTVGRAGLKKKNLSGGVVLRNQ